MASARHAPKRTLITTPHDTELRMERTFDAPRTLVWRAYTDPALIARWMGPRRLKIRIEQMDVRPGGRWRFVHTDEDGTEYGFHGEFLEVVPPERIVQTWVFEGMPDASSVETMQLLEKDGRTTVVSTAKYKTRAHRDAHVESGMEAGVNEGFDRLEELLERLQATAGTRR